MKQRNIALIGSVLAIMALISFLDIKSKSQNLSLVMFQKWKVKQGRTYQTQFEHSYRLSVFLDNLLEIETHNADTSKTYKKGLNQFSDLTNVQFAAFYLNQIANPEQISVLTSESVSKKTRNPKQSRSADQKINWLQLGYVTEVKDMGKCAAFWVFSPLASIEAANKQHGNPLVSLSAQQLIDCSGHYGNIGCNGGLMDNSYKYVKENGVTTEEEYPYKGVKQTCKIQGGSVKIKYFSDLCGGCDVLAEEIMKRPMTVGVDARQFSKYESGIFNGCEIKHKINHSVTVVGMDDDYWLVKEAFGVNWGQKGYMRIARDTEHEFSTCGICDMPSYPEM